MTLPPIPCCRILPGPSLCMQPIHHDPKHEAVERRRHGPGWCDIDHLQDDACRKAHVAKVQKRRAAERRRAGSAVAVLLLLPLLLGAKGCGDDHTGPARDPCRHMSGHGPQPCQITTTPTEGAR